MSKYGIETFDDLYADRDRLRGEMDKLVAYRTKQKITEKGATGTMMYKEMDDR